MAKYILYSTWGPEDGGCGHKHPTRAKAIECRARHDAKCAKLNTWEPTFTGDRWVIEMAGDTTDVDNVYRQRKAEYERGRATEGQ